MYDVVQMHLNIGPIDVEYTKYTIILAFDFNYNAFAFYFYAKYLHLYLHIKADGVNLHLPHFAHLPLHFGTRLHVPQIGLCMIFLTSYRGLP